jgi:hypothetical protein
MTVYDFRSGIDAGASDVARGLDGKTERSSLAAAVVPLRQISSPHPHERLSPARLRQIDRVFYGPFFREKYGAGGDKALENGRIRYYGPVQFANNAGELAGRRYVHEFDTMSGSTRGWHETLDRMGKVRQIRPERRDGVVRHYQFDSNGRYKGSW